MPAGAAAPEGEWRSRLDGAVAAGGGQARRFRPEGDDGAERTAARAGGEGEGEGGDNTRRGGGPGLPTCATGSEGERLQLVMLRMLHSRKG